MATVAAGEEDCLFPQGNNVALIRCNSKQLGGARGVAADTDAVPATY